METLKEFVKRFSRDVGCHYKENKRNYSLKKYDSDRRNHMGVFGWVGVRSTQGFFVISTYEYLADALGIATADRRRLGAHYISKDEDRQGKATGLYYHVGRGSIGADYQKAVSALKVIRANR